MQQQCKQEPQVKEVLELGYCERCGTLGVHQPGSTRAVCRACAGWLRWLQGEAQP